jgi:hypothetical protein
VPSNPRRGKIALSRPDALGCADVTHQTNEAGELGGILYFMVDFRAGDGFLRSREGRGGGRVSCCMTDPACCPLVPRVVMAPQRVHRGRNDRGIGSGGCGSRGHASVGGGCRVTNEMITKWRIYNSSSNEMRLGA